MRSRHSLAGFTLLELVIVIALMGVVTTLGAIMLSHMTDRWQQVQGRTVLDRGVEDLAFDAMQRDFADIVSARLSGASIQGTSRNAKEAAAELADDEVILPVRIPADGEGPERVARIIYRIERTDERNDLVRVLAPLDDPSKESEPTVVLRGALSMRIEYADSDTNQGWLPNWSAPELPDAVRVSLAVRDTRRDPAAAEEVARKATFMVNVD